MLRRLPTSRLLALIVAVCAVLAGGTAIAIAAIGGSRPTPPAKPLAVALHDAATAPTADGITARIKFTNRLIDGASLASGSNPLLTGATGRLWAASDGRFRLELQSDRGDAEIVGDGDVVTVYDGTSNTAYRITLPKRSGKAETGKEQPPTLARIQDFLAKLAQKADLSGATPSNVAGQPAYTVRVSPKHDGGLIGAAELAWDAAHGTPLRAAVYASGDSRPVLELEATDITFGPVAGTALSATPPAGAKVTKVDLGGGGASKHKGGDHPEVSGAKAVAAKLPFGLSAPGTLVGLPRREVRLVELDGAKGALVTYGAGLGGIAVLEQPAQPKDAAARPGEQGGLALPKVSIGGAGGEELATALGTLVRFERGGVQYTVVGSVPPAAAEAAARAL